LSLDSYLHLEMKAPTKKYNHAVVEFSNTVGEQITKNIMFSKAQHHFITSSRTSRKRGLT